MNTLEVLGPIRRAFKRAKNNGSGSLGTFFHITKQRYFKHQRSKQLESNIPDIRNHKTVLYIGARKERIDFGDQFVSNNYSIDILEIFEPNAAYLKNISWINKVIHEDVTTIEKSTKEKYDVVFWWHGPEHITKDKLAGTLQKLNNCATKLVVCGCPRGRFDQDEIYENPHEKHVSQLYPEDFVALGFNTSTIGQKDFPGSNILAWKKIDSTQDD